MIIFPDQPVFDARYRPQGRFVAYDFFWVFCSLLGPTSLSLVFGSGSALSFRDIAK